MESKIKLGKLFKYHTKNICKYLIWAVIIYFTIFFIGKDFNINDHFSAITEYKYEFIIGSFAMVIALRKLIKKILLLYVSPCINSLDALCAYTILTVSMLLLKYQDNRLAVALCILIMLSIARFIIYAIRDSDKQNTYDSNIIWLHQAYYNQIETNKSQVLIRDEASDIDLIDQGQQFNTIVSAIVNCNPDNTFSIGLDGKWNKGKTTTMNIVKNKIKNQTEDIIIVDFDPCKFENCESMLKGFYNSIAEELDIVNLTKYKIALKSLIKEVISNNIGKIDFDTLLGEFFSKDEVNDLIISELENSNKRLLIIVDNLDRANTELVNFFLRCTYSITRFKHTIFLVIYDSEILNKQLGKYYATDSLFMNKIINLPIILPKTDESKINDVFNTCLKNLVNAGYIEDVIDEKQVDFYGDFREVIRALNYLLYNSITVKKLKFNVYDLLGLLYIKEHEPAVYDEIYRNSAYLTFGQNMDYTSEQKNEEVKKKLKMLYDKIESSTCKNIVCNMFSIMNIIHENSDIDLYMARAVKGNCIENHYYFNMYFYLNANKYSKCDIKIKDEIEEIEKAGHRKELYEQLLQSLILNEDDIACRGYNAETICENYIDKLDAGLLYQVCKMFTIRKAEASSYLTSIMYKAFSSMSEADFIKEQKNMRTDYNHLWFYWKFTSVTFIEESRAILVDSTIRAICNEIKSGKNSVNLLSDKYYNPINIFVYGEYVGEQQKRKSLRSWINTETVINYVRYCVNVTSYEKAKFSINNVDAEANEKAREVLANIKTAELESNTKKMVEYYLEDSLPVSSK